MAFMEPEYIETEWITYATDSGEEYTIPSEYYTDDLGEIVSREHAIGARLSAPGYMDCTGWTTFATIEEAREYIMDTFDVDPESGDDLDY